MFGPYQLYYKNNEYNHFNILYYVTFYWNFLLLIMAFNFHTTYINSDSATHQIFADVDWLLKDRPHNCFIAAGGGQRAHVPVELCEVYISNKVINRKGTVNLSVCDRKEKRGLKKKSCN